MSLAIKSPRLLPNIVDQGRSHGSKDSKVTGMSSTQKFDYLSLAPFLSLPHEQAEEYSSKEQEEGETEEEEVEDGDEEDEDEEEEDDDEEEEEKKDDEEEEFGVCNICLKDNEHSKYDCPYLDCILNPTKVTLGSGYDIACRGCYRLGGHPDRASWEGRAIKKSCFICHVSASHWGTECPRNPNPGKFVRSNRRVVMRATYTPLPSRQT